MRIYEIIELKFLILNRFYSVKLKIKLIKNVNKYIQNIKILLTAWSFIAWIKSFNENFTLKLNVLARFS